MDRERLDVAVEDRPEIPLDQRKAEFLEAMRGIDPLATLRLHPWVTVGTALMFGLTTGSPHLAAKVKQAKGGLAGRIIKGVGLRVAQHFIATRAAKAQAEAMAAASPQTQAAQASA